MPSKLSTEEFVRKAIIVHNGKYDYSLVLYENGRTRVPIVCPEHGVWYQTPENHLAGKGCQRCGYERVRIARRTTNYEDIKVPGFTWVGNEYVHQNSNTEWKCNNCGYVRMASYRTMINRDPPGCPICNPTSISLTVEIFTLRSQNVHSQRYDYSKVKLIDSRTKVEIVCPTHGSFWQQPTSHMSGVGCPQCNPWRVKTPEDYHATASKNGILWVGNFPSRTDGNTEWECTKGHRWLACYDNIKQGKSCPACNTPRGERKVALLLDKLGIKYIHQYTFDACRNPLSGKLLPFDFYLPDDNTLIEYHGEQHYQPHKFFGGERVFATQRFRDDIKAQFAANSNIPLIVLPYKEEKNIEQIVIEKLQEVTHG